MSNKMTAIQWLEMKIVELEKDYAIPHSIYELCEEAKQMEKEQMMDAFDKGQEYQYHYHVNSAPKFYSITYYKETYEQ